MNNILSQIQQRSKLIHTGLIRVSGKERNTYPVRISSMKEATAECIIEEKDLQKLKGKKIKLFQKLNSDFLIFSGKIELAVSLENNKRLGIICIFIEQATWCIKKIDGPVTWLEEKFSVKNKNNATLYSERALCRA